MKSPGQGRGAPDPHPRRGALGERYSKSADAARRKEYARIARLSPLRRMLLALELGEQVRHLRRRGSARRALP
jgi:hypothetical protein